MIASSTTIDIERVSANNVKIFKVNPEKYRIINVPIIDVGIENRILIDDWIFPRKSKQTRIVIIEAAQSFSIVKLTVLFVD